MYIGGMIHKTMGRLPSLRALVSVAFCLYLLSSHVESGRPRIVTEDILITKNTDDRSHNEILKQIESKSLVNSISPDGEKWIFTKVKMPSVCKEHNCMLSDLTEVPRGTLGEFVVEFEMDEPGKELQEWATRELNETPEHMEKSIARLQELLREERKKGLLAPVDNVAWLKMFLRATHYSPEKAFQKVRNYYEFKVKNQELYNDLKPSKERNLFKQDIMTVLPVRDQKGRRVLIVEIGSKWNYRRCSLDEIFKGAVLFLEAAMLEPKTQIAGGVVIFDMKGFDFWRQMQFVQGFSFIQRVVELLQEAAPIRIGGLHFVNESSYFSLVFKAITKLLNEEFKDRIHSHGKNYASLHKFIFADRLPPKYGGKSVVPRVPGLEWYTALTMLDKEYEAVNSFGYKNRKE